MRNIRPLDKYTVSYSPNREDIILQNVLGDTTKGAYVDVGAGHPTHASATRLFYELGWSGINITPSERIEHALKKFRSRDVVVRAFLDSNGSCKTKYTEQLGDAELKQYTNSYDVDVSTLRDILSEHPMDEIDFLKINTSGSELDVLNGFDWKGVRPKILCVACSDENAIDAYMTSIKYVKFFFDDKNQYWADKTYYAKCAPRVDQRVYGQYIVGPYVADELQLLHRTINSQREKILQLKSMSSDKSEINVDSIRLREMGKIVAKKVDAHIQGTLLPAISYSDIRPKFGEQEATKDYDANAWFSLVDQYDKRNIPGRLHPRRVAMGVYRRAKRGVKKMVKR